jgi:LexA-binding, inner membrane-associated putative hydrolase
MDIVAHGLWAGIGVAAAARRWPVTRRTGAATVALAMAPDLAQLLPLIVVALTTHGGWATLAAYAAALPGTEPALPPLVALLTHHLHCILHSAVIAAVVTLACWVFMRSLWLPLLGWWSHIVIDIFTHSKSFYPAPIFYPFTQWGFDGLAWNTPWFLLLNHAAIALAITCLLWRRWTRRI